MSDAEYDKLQMQGYLKSNGGLSDEETLLLVKFILWMARVRNNYSNQYQDKRCQLCQSEDEDQILMLSQPINIIISSS